MKILKTLFLSIAFISIKSMAQVMPTEGLPTATLDENFHLTLDLALPVADYYKVDISHLEFLNEEDAIKKCRVYLTGNLISNEVHFSENFIIVHIHTEYLAGDLDHAKIQTYLNQLRKPE